MKNSMVEELGDQPLFLCCFNLLFLFFAHLSKPLFYYYCYCYLLLLCRYILNTDLLILTIEIVRRRLEVIWPQLYYHLSSVRQVYATTILIWQQNDNYQGALNEFSWNLFTLFGSRSAIVILILLRSAIVVCICRVTCSNLRWGRIRWSDRVIILDTFKLVEGLCSMNSTGVKTLITQIAQGNSYLSQLRGYPQWV